MGAAPGHYRLFGPSTASAPLLGLGVSVRQRLSRCVLGSASADADSSCQAHRGGNRDWRPLHRTSEHPCCAPTLFRGSVGPARHWIVAALEPLLRVAAAMAAPRSSPPCPSSTLLARSRCAYRSMPATRSTAASLPPPPTSLDLSGMPHDTLTTHPGIGPSPPHRDPRRSPLSPSSEHDYWLTGPGHEHHPPLIRRRAPISS